MLKILKFIQPIFLLIAAIFGFKMARDIKNNQELSGVRKARRIEKTNRGLKRDDLINGL